MKLLAVMGWESNSGPRVEWLGALPLEPSLRLGDLFSQLMHTSFFRLSTDGGSNLFINLGLTGSISKTLRAGTFPTVAPSPEPAELPAKAYGGYEQSPFTPAVPCLVLQQRPREATKPNKTKPNRKLQTRK